MTKWARLRKLKEKRKAEAEALKPKTNAEVKPTEPENISNNVKHSQETQKFEIPKTSKLNPILAQIPSYICLAAIFALLSAVFFPIVTVGAEGAWSLVIGGIAVLFLGLAGGILLFKGLTSGSRFFIVVGFSLITISLVFIFQLQDWFKADYGFL